MSTVVGGSSVLASFKVLEVSMYVTSEKSCQRSYPAG